MKDNILYFLTALIKISETIFYSEYKTRFFTAFLQQKKRKRLGGENALSTMSIRLDFLFGDYKCLVFTTITLLKP